MDYLARVELNGERSTEDYILLQTKLEEAKFYTTIIGGNGNTPLQLPSGTYYCYGTYPNPNSAHAAIAKSLGETLFKASVVVAAVTAWQSSNLHAPPGV